MPVNANSSRKYFVKHPVPAREGKAFMLILDRGSIIVNKIPQKEPTIISAIENLLMDDLSVK